MKPLLIALCLVADTLLCGLSRHAYEDGQHGKSYALWAVAFVLSVIIGLFVAAERTP